jgi:hypothetical protein
LIPCIYDLLRSILFATIVWRGQELYPAVR